MTACVRKMAVNIHPLELHSERGRAGCKQQRSSVFENHLILIRFETQWMMETNPAFPAFTLFRGRDSYVPTDELLVSGTAPFFRVRQRTFCLNCTYTVSRRRKKKDQQKHRKATKYMEIQ